MLNFKQRLTKITTLFFDVDGVLTDGKVILTETGELLRNMNSKDGFALQLAVKKGLRIVILSGGNNEAAKIALMRAGITDIFIKQADKLKCYLEFVSANNLSHEEIAYMGDDLPDWEVMSKVGLATCPNDAATEIKEISVYISDKKGGEGCVRDILEQTMRAQGKWEISNW